MEELAGETVGRLVAAVAGRRRRPGVLTDDTQAGCTGVGDGPARRRPGVDERCLLQRQRGVRRLAAVLRRVQLAGDHGRRVADPGHVGENVARAGRSGDGPQLVGVEQTPLQTPVVVGRAVQRRCGRGGEVGGQDPSPGERHVDRTVISAVAQEADLPEDCAGHRVGVPVEPRADGRGVDWPALPRSRTGQPAGHGVRLRSNGKPVAGQGGVVESPEAVALRADLPARVAELTGLAGTDTYGREPVERELGGQPVEVALCRVANGRAEHVVRDPRGTRLAILVEVHAIGQVQDPGRCVLKARSEDDAEPGVGAPGEADAQVVDVALVELLGCGLEPAPVHPHLDQPHTGPRQRGDAVGERTSRRGRRTPAPACRAPGRPCPSGTPTAWTRRPAHREPRPREPSGVGGGDPRDGRPSAGGATWATAPARSGGTRRGPRHRPSTRPGRCTRAS